jgi:hypothetical protein
MEWRNILYLGIYNFGKTGEWKNELYLGNECFDMRLTEDQLDLIEDVSFTMENFTLTELAQIKKESKKEPIYCEIIFENGKYLMFEHTKYKIIKKIATQLKLGMKEAQKSKK